MYIHHGVSPYFVILLLEGIVGYPCLRCGGGRAGRLQLIEAASEADLSDPRTVGITWEVKDEPGTCVSNAQMIAITNTHIFYRHISYQITRHIV